MIAANKYLWLFLFLLLSFGSLAQKTSERLKNEQKKLEKQIETTKTLVAESRKKTQLSLEEVQLIGQQVKYRERLLNNIDNQIRSSELKIKQKTKKISTLEADIETLKSQYKALLIYAYKKRSQYGNLLYIFSAPTLEQALKRKLYLEKLAEIQKKQLRVINQKKELLADEISSLAEEKEAKLVLAEQKRKERKEILVAKQEKEKIYQAFKAKEREVLAELKLQEEKSEQLQAAVQKAIQKEIAEEQARLEKERREAEARRKAEEERKKSETPTVEEPKDPRNTTPFLSTKEVELAGANFASNRGRLPWPVAKGTITKDYGKNAHPTLHNVYTQNNGLDISTAKNAVVRSIFDGEVTSVINIPGAGKVIIVKHGNYRSVYSNIQDAYVNKGTVVATKTPLGSLLPSKDGSISVAHFEIHEVKDGNVNQLNPNLWITN